MKAVELPAYRAFMFAVVPQLLRDNPTIQQAIAEAEELWSLIDEHVLEVTEKLEND